jgi:hypothetical protein
MATTTSQKLAFPLQWVQAQRVKARRKAPNLEVDLKRARQIADLLDNKFEVAGVRFGLEALVGLIPVVGDTVGALAGVYPIWVANRHKLGKGVQARMAANLAVEWAGGLVPYVGDFFDVAFKANIRNFKLLEKAAAKAGER